MCGHEGVGVSMRGDASSSVCIAPPRQAFLWCADGHAPAAHCPDGDAMQQQTASQRIPPPLFALAPPIVQLALSGGHSRRGRPWEGETNGFGGERSRLDACGSTTFPVEGVWLKSG